METSTPTQNRTETEDQKKSSPFVEEAAKAGAHLGHKVSEIHPKMRPYLCGVRNGVHIINLEKTEERLDAALEFLKKMVVEGKTVLFVSTKVQLREYVEETASESGMPFITRRWLGGTFTNFETMKKRLEYFKELEEKMKSEEMEKYTKLERLRKEKELEELRKKFSGIRKLQQLPDVLFVVDANEEIAAVREARGKKIPIVGIVDTNTDPGLVDYPIPANDDTISSVKLILGRVKEAMVEAKK